jgi:hypothetical protein
MENNQFQMPPPPPPPPPPSHSAPTVAATQETYNYAADLMINKKIKAAEVRNMLMQQGIDAQAATTVVDALGVEISKQKKERAKRDMMFGGGICIVGLIITLVSYSVASSSGGTYVVTWGAVIFGALQFFKGLISMRA